MQTVFGVETANFTASATGILSASPTWVRRNSLTWKDVEPAQNNRNWSAAKAVEDDLVLASKNNMRAILIIYGTPSWAQQIAGKACGFADSGSGFAQTASNRRLMLFA